MITKYKRQFSKDLDELPTAELKAEVAAVIRAVEAATSLSDIGNVKKLKGYKTAYRIRVGAFRIGLVVENHKSALCASLIAATFTASSLENKKGSAGIQQGLSEFI